VERLTGIVSRGFSGKRKPAGTNLPPGQYLTADFPVLSATPTPQIPLDRWELTITENGKVLQRWDWTAFRALTAETITTDIHCVTRWSKLGTRWEGVSIDTLLAGVQSDDAYVMAHSYSDYSTNVPLRDLTNGRAWVAFAFDGKDLEPEHGGPARLLVPHEDLIATWPASRSAACYICGPTAFVERAASLLTAAGYAPERVKMERFDPTGQTR